MDIKEFYRLEKNHIIDNCTACGMCVKGCPIIVKTPLKEIKPKVIQKAVKNFLADGRDGPILRDRVLSCMECFKCVEGMCPQGLNPLRALEIAKWEIGRRDPELFPAYDTRDPELSHRVLASIQTTPVEYQRILTPSPPKKARYVFFPGCNVYFQPEKLLNAMDVMGIIDPDYAFVPGLDVCCGDCHAWYGRPERVEDAIEGLIAAAAAYDPEVLVLWCPTCQCRLGSSFAPTKEYPFRAQSLPQFISENLDRLPLPEPQPMTVTVHEACKAAFTGLDPVGPRTILAALGAEVIEMPRHGKGAVCCGSGAIERFPAACHRMADERIKEAAETGAPVMATVCHFCNQLLAGRGTPPGFRVESYINLLAAALGVHREDKFTRYRHWADVDRIRADAAEAIAKSPFPRDVIDRTIRNTFVDG